MPETCLGTYPMTTLTHFLSEDHNHCDTLFVAAENAVAARDWALADEEFDHFLAGMKRHFAMEEEVLFPAFEQRTGSAGGPTFVMRSEHRQMSGLLDEMAGALRQNDDKGYLGLSETLLMLMRQHNMKEENILYPMSDQAMDGEQSALIARMEQFGN